MRRALHASARGTRGVRSLAVLAALATVVLSGACRTSAPSGAGPGGIQLEGMASWYGAEFAGRPTANGEIFDPLTMTAAHRTLPFGTIVDVTNLKNGRSTRVRINDRGPFVGDRIIDVSYAAARSLDMVEDGVSRVRLDIVRLGRGDREPPEPYAIKIDEEPTEEVPAVTPTPEPVRMIGEEPTNVAGRPLTPASDLIPDADSPKPGSRPEPKPSPATTQPPPASPQTAQPPPAPRPTPPPAVSEPQPRPTTTSQRPERGWKVQVGAFGVEDNARRLAAELAGRMSNVFVELVGGLYRVRVGPFASRTEAIDASERVQSLGYESIVLSPDAR